MPDAPRRRFTLPLLVLGFLFIGSCAGGGGGVAPDHDCTNGVGANRRENPVICVDNVGGELSVHPNRIWAWDALEADRTPNKLHWMTRSRSGDLQIRFKDESCVEEPQCDRRGRCHARTVTLTDPKDVRRCKYDVIVDGRVLDPDVIITKCCSNEEPPQ